MENKQGNLESGSRKKSNAKALEDLHKKVIEKDDDGFEDFKQRLNDQIEAFQNKLNGGNEEIRRPKLPVTSFLRYHMEEFNLVKAKKPEWTPNQIAKSIKQLWETMSDTKKQRYIDAYEHDYSKYQRLVSDFEKLTQKSKKPITPFFQFFSDNLQEYKKNYPQLSQNEVTSIIGKDWSKFDTSKKKQMQAEYDLQLSLYTKAIKNKGNQNNNYVDYNDYMQKVEDYENELEDELEALRSKYPKAPTVSDIKKDLKQKTETSKEDQSLKNKKAQKQAKKVAEAANSNNSSSKSQEKVAKQSQIADLNKKQKSINIEDDLKDARRSNRQNSKDYQNQKKITRPAHSLKEEPTLRKQVKVEKPEQQKTIPKGITKSAVGSNKTINQSEKVEAKAKTRSQSKQNKKPIVSSAVNHCSVSSKKEIKLRTSSRLQEGKSKTKVIQKLAKVPQRDTIKNVKILKRRVIQEKIIEKSKKGQSKSKQVDLNVSERRENSTLKKDQKTGFIKHMLGMRNGEETQYLVHFQDGKQKWTNEDDPIFKEKRNSYQLGIFLQQIKENQN